MQAQGLPAGKRKLTGSEQEVQLLRRGMWGQL